MALTGKERARIRREKKKRDPVKWADYKRKDALRKSNYRRTAERNDPVLFESIKLNERARQIKSREKVVCLPCLSVIYLILKRILLFRARNRMKNDEKFKWNERLFDASLRNSHSVTIPKIFEASNFLFLRQYTLSLD